MEYVKISWIDFYLIYLSNQKKKPRPLNPLIQRYEKLYLFTINQKPAERRDSISHMT